MKPASLVKIVAYMVVFLVTMIIVSNLAFRHPTYDGWGVGIAIIGILACFGLLISDDWS